MTLFPISFIIEAIVEMSRFMLQMVQAIRISDLFSTGESLKPVELLRKVMDALIF